MQFSPTQKLDYTNPIHTNTGLSSPRVICVLGMHRAGTSALTKALSTLGVGLGDHLLGPCNFNPKGLFENKEIVRLNTELLHEVGHSWSSLGLIDSTELSGSKHGKIFQKAARIVAEYTSRFSIWGFKDPRTARLLPFWQEVFAHLGLPASYVIVLRNPLDVARSLQARDNMPEACSHIMWLQHYLTAFRYTEAEPRLVVNYDQLMAGPHQQLRRLFNFLGLPPVQWREELAGDYCERFLDSSLCHHSSSIEDLNEVMKAALPFASLLELYEWALALAEDLVSNEDLRQKVLDLAAESLKAHCEFLPLVNDLGAQIVQLRSQIDSLRSSRLLRFLRSNRGRILLKMRILPRWMQRLVNAQELNAAK